jgi:hypothetical protein
MRHVEQSVLSDTSLMLACFVCAHKAKNFSIITPMAVCIFTALRENVLRFEVLEDDVGLQGQL